MLHQNFHPQPFFTDHLTAAVLASSNSPIYKRIKPHWVVELGGCDDMRLTECLRITHLLTVSLLLISLFCTHKLKVWFKCMCFKYKIVLCLHLWKMSRARGLMRREERLWRERASKMMQKTQAAAMQGRQKCYYIFNIMSPFLPYCKYTLMFLFQETATWRELNTRCKFWFCWPSGWKL